MVEEWQRIVPEEGNVNIICECRQVERVSKKRGEETRRRLRLSGQDGKEEELHDVEMQI